LSQLMQQTVFGHGETGAPSEDNDGHSTSAGNEANGVDSQTPAEGGAAPNDNLNDVPAGDGTFLNTREWKYAAFFNRVKQAVSAHWSPNGRMGNKSIGYTDRNTVVQVALRPDGTIADLFVSKSCGMDALDQEAMQAFEKAAPFLNPPPQLIEQGYVRFGFSFTVMNEGMSVPRMLRLPGR
jgi:TonB family protein